MTIRKSACEDFWSHARVGTLGVRVDAADAHIDGTIRATLAVEFVYLVRWMELEGVTSPANMTRMETRRWPLAVLTATSSGSLGQGHGTKRWSNTFGKRGRRNCPTLKHLPLAAAVLIARSGSTR